MGQRVHADMTVHALERAVERFPELKNFDRITLEKILIRHYRRSEVYGSSYIPESYFVKANLGGKPIIFVVKHAVTATEGLLIVTIMTLEECHKNGGFKAT